MLHCTYVYERFRFLVVWSSHFGIFEMIEMRAASPGRDPSLRIPEANRSCSEFGSLADGRCHVDIGGLLGIHVPTYDDSLFKNALSPW